MTERLYLHVGSPKSGTTYLQGILEQNRDALARAGVLVVGERHLDRIHAAMAVREDKRLEGLPPRRRDQWRRLVAQVREWTGPSAVLSYELFSGASREQAQRALADLEGVEVHLVVTARDLGGAVPSAWQEQLKFGLRRPLEDWTPPPASARREWGWRTMDPAGVAARWGGGLPPAQVHVVTVPRAGGDPAELWRRFAEACDLVTVPVDLAVGPSNTSLGVVEAELLRRVNGRLPEPLRSSNREQAIWLRDTLAHEVLAPLGSEPIGLTDDHLAEARAVADQAVSAIQDAGYAVHGDLADLRPRAREARLPGDVADSELLESALEAVVALLSELRERDIASHHRRPAEENEVSSLGQLARTAVRRAVNPRVRRRDESLRERIAELEAEVQQARELHLRVAVLHDVVAELLLPLPERNPTLTVHALRRYRRDSL